MTTVTRRIEFDAGHRVPLHQGQCRRPHGHHYVVELTVSGATQVDGMIVDFGIMKELLVEHVHDVCDHRFLVQESDVALVDALRSVDPECVVVMADAPTAENIAAFVYDTMLAKLPEPLRVARVRVSETPNCWADYP